MFKMMTRKRIMKMMTAKTRKGSRMTLHSVKGSGAAVALLVLRAALE